jgi:DNA repair exonuclease SbcCD ATPase subunit
MKAGLMMNPKKLMPQPVSTAGSEIDARGDSEYAHRMNIHPRFPSSLLLTAALFSLSALFACSSTYYTAMEKVGIHKRDILVDRVEGARDAQTRAQEEFSSALEKFSSVVELEETDLKAAYEKMRDAYDRSKERAEEVSERIDSVESVAGALFAEWEDELSLYQNAKLRRSSEQKLDATRRQYEKMLAKMRDAEEKMEPVLQTFQDNVLYLKHNLNAQAIGALRTEFASLRGQIDTLIEKMNSSIQASNAFIAELQ